ncbi:sensor histidine kinase [Roseospirillum parvum]|uniref:histidine kinase n=1 Tax=Roseospirillum parvum TaxID=83401 RepID=A0A1G7X0L6_9PROT|nr:PAS domain-containing sensor histidine kinase [Roseospirillum parvum]SDG77696.1 PAS domain S-box-containing protein [Roseospirillum parvum]
MTRPADPVAEAPGFVLDTLKATFTHSSVGFSLVGLDGAYLWVNDAFCRMVGRPWEELRDLTFRDLTHPDDLPTSDQLAGRLFAGGIDSARIEKRYSRANGQTMRAIVHLSLIRDADGHPGCVAGLLEDITERHAAVEALATAERSNRALLDAAPDAAFLFRPDGHLLACNATFAGRFGKRPQDIIGSDLFTLFPPQLAASRRARTDQVAASGIPAVIEDVREGLHFENHIHPIPGPDGTVALLAGHSRDITGRVHESARLRRNEAILNQVAEQTGAAFCQLRVPPGRPERARLVYLSESAESLLGQPPAALLAAGPNVLLGDSLRDESNGAAANRAERLAALTQGAPWQGEVKITAQGTPRWLKVTLTPDPQPDGGTIYNGVLIDITDSRRAWEELERSNQDLQQFAYVASHDLQEPLRMVTSFLQLLERRYADRLDDEGRQIIHYAVEGAVRMRNLILDLLDYSRVSFSVHHPGPLDLGPIVARVRHDLALTVHESNAEIVIDPLPRVQADPAHMAQLFTNLIGNALKYRAAERPPRVRVAAHDDAPPGQVHISVTDNGIGIDPAFFGRIFQIFQRLHPRDAYPGTGVGLALCQRIVERLGGRIWVESTPGAGSTFHVILPTAQPPAPG